MNGKSEKEERDERNDEAYTKMKRLVTKSGRAYRGKVDITAVLQRRMNAKIRYRRKRDRRFNDRWLGAEFVLDLRQPANPIVPIRFVVVRYNPDRATIRVQYLYVEGRPGVRLDTVSNSKIWDTDQFWRWYRSGEVREA